MQAAPPQQQVQMMMLQRQMQDQSYPYAGYNPSQLQNKLLMMKLKQQSSFYQQRNQQQQQLSERQRLQQMQRMRNQSSSLQSMPTQQLVADMHSPQLTAQQQQNPHHMSQLHQQGVAPQLSHGQLYQQPQLNQEFDPNLMQQEQSHGKQDAFYSMPYVNNSTSVDMQWGMLPQGTFDDALPTTTTVTSVGGGAAQTTTVEMAHNRSRTGSGDSEGAFMHTPATQGSLASIMGGQTPQLRQGFSGNDNQTWALAAQLGQTRLGLPLTGSGEDVSNWFVANRVSPGGNDLYAERRLLEDQESMVLESESGFNLHDASRPSSFLSDSTMWGENGGGGGSGNDLSSLFKF